MADRAAASLQWLYFRTQYLWVTEKFKGLQLHLEIGNFHCPYYLASHQSKCAPYPFYPFALSSCGTVVSLLRPVASSQLGGGHIVCHVNPDWCCYFRRDSGGGGLCSGSSWYSRGRTCTGCTGGTRCAACSLCCRCFWFCVTLRPSSL